MIFEILVYPGFVFLVLVSMIYYGILRKVAARMQNRIGPPVWQPVLDFIKLVGKEDLTPEQAKAGFTLWPFIAITSVLIAGLLTPIAGVVPLSFTGDIVVLIYFLTMGTVSAAEDRGPAVEMPLAAVEEKEESAEPGDGQNSSSC